MLHRVKELLVIVIIITSLTLACADEFTLTSLSLSEGAVGLQWDTPTNMFIIELFTNIFDDTICCAYSTGAIQTNMYFAAPSNALCLFRLQFGLHVVEFKDSELEQYVRYYISNKLVPENSIYSVEIQDITFFYPSYSCITNLAGIEYMTGLLYFYIHDSCVSDIGPISALTNLYLFEAFNNQIVDIGPLSNLTQIVELRLQQNQISDLNALQGLTNLNSLILSDNYITNIESLIYNASNGGLGTGDYVYLTGNVIANTNQVEELRSYGASVYYP